MLLCTEAEAAQARLAAPVPDVATGGNATPLPPNMVVMGMVPQPAPHGNPRPGSDPADPRRMAFGRVPFDPRFAPRQAGRDRAGPGVAPSTSAAATQAAEPAVSSASQAQAAASDASNVAAYLAEPPPLLDAHPVQPMYHQLQDQRLGLIQRMQQRAAAALSGAAAAPAAGNQATGVPYFGHTSNVSPGNPAQTPDRVQIGGQHPAGTPVHRMHFHLDPSGRMSGGPWPLSGPPGQVQPHLSPRS